MASVATVVGVVLLFSFKTPDATRPRGALAVVPGPSPADTGGGTPSPSADASASPSPPAGRYKDGQYTGPDVQNRFGDVQVKVIISGGRIKDVQAVQLPFDRPRSAEISQQAGPLLHDEVIAAQSAQIDSLGGATYTSDSYAQSVQAALDMAH
ncbi:MAG: FMN-binding protein [Candidatus Dormibacteraeota bacterium]|nr:FMN-binding protein [Candidatus Dormibacteraeota bacterium]